MKKIFQLFLLLFSSAVLLAQAPEKINYQAVARDLSGNPLINQTLSVTFEIRQGSSSGLAVYIEAHTGLITNQFGLFTAEIGGGNPSFGTFPGIQWGNGLHYLAVLINGNLMGSSQLLSVPYALYAKESQNGLQGLPGRNSLSIVTAEPIGSNCLNGGNKIEIGTDDNGNNTLEPLEIDFTYYVCNGDSGATGIGINWIGNNITFPPTPNAPNDAFYHTIHNTSYIYNGTIWDTLVSGNVGSAGYWSQSGNTIYNNNIFGTGNVSIGTPLSFGKLTVASPAADSLIASFIGSNPTVSAITISNTNPTGAAGVTFLSGTNITSYVAYSPSIKTLSLVNDVTDGHIYINSDSTIVNQTKIIANQTEIIANQAQNAIYNNTDTIYNYSPAGAVVHVNQGLFMTDSLYVLGNNFLNPNWVLANNGLGQAKWTDPNTLSLWQSNTPNIYFNTGNVGIGTAIPNFKLHVSSNDTIISAFTGTNTFGSVIMVSNSLPNIAGMLMKSGVDSAFVGYNSSDKTLEFGTMDKINGNIRISTGKKIELRADTIYAASEFNPVIYNTNKGIFFTDSLYVYGTGYATSGNVLTTNGNGKAQWQSPAGAANAWNLTGNAVTNPATNFIGTTDNIPLNFRVNNQTAGKIDAANANTFFGYVAGSSTTGYYNTAIGTSALFSNTTGYNNTASGYRVLYSNTTGYENTAIGSYVLYSNVTGYNGVAIGYNSQYYANNTPTAWENTNTSVGYNSLRGSTTPANNTGLYNTAIGREAMLNNSTGYNNTASGSYALVSNMIGYNNTALGNNSLLNTTGDQNTGIGKNSGGSNGSGSNNTFIGYNANAAVSNLTNVTAVGANAIVSQSNSLILGNAANVGIGTATPQEKLEVQGNIRATQIQIENTSSLIGWQLGGEIGFPSGDVKIQSRPGQSIMFYEGSTNENMRITATGNVGVGKPSPTVKLDVNGDVAFNQYTFTSPGTTYNAFNTNNMSYVRMDITNNTVLNGILAPAGTDGKILIMHFHITNGTLMINSESAVAAVQNRLRNLTQGNLTLSTAGLDMILTYVYSIADQRWMLVSKN